MICRIYDVQGAKLEHYDAVSERVGTDKPEGARVHIAGATDGGFMVIEVWDSVEDVNRYMEQGVGKEPLGQAIQAVMQGTGLPEPKITEFEVHTLDWVA